MSFSLVDNLIRNLDSERPHRGPCCAPALAPLAAPAGDHGGGGCPGKRRRSAPGGKPADKLICNNASSFLEAATKSSQLTSMSAVPWPRRAAKGDGKERGGRESRDTTPLPHPNTQFHWQKHQGVIQAEPTLAKLGLRISPSQGEAGREGNRPGAPSPHLPAPRLLGAGPQALPAHWS